MPNHAPRRREGGFALLLVFLLAGCIAISLYMELPRVMFEAQRGKEQLLIDHGEQYKRAIQVYYRQYRRYPPDLDALDSTDNRHFLRHRYRDPMTGEDQWRLIHGFPNGVFTDSLVYKTPGQAGKTDSSTTATTDAAATGQSTTATSPWMQRRPSDGTVSGGMGQAGTAEPGVESPPDGSMWPAAPVATDMTADGQMVPSQAAAEQAQAGQQSAAGVTPPVPSIPGQPVMQQPVGIFPGQIPTVPVSSTGTQPQQTGNNEALRMIQQLLTTPNPRGPVAVQLAGSNQQTGGVSGIAGVASRLEAEGIMVYNDRTKYNEWEFIYDVRQDTTSVGPTMVPSPTPVPAGPTTGGTTPEESNPRRPRSPRMPTLPGR